MVLGIVCCFLIAFVELLFLSRAIRRHLFYNGSIIAVVAIIFPMVVHFLLPIVYMFRFVNYDGKDVEKPDFFTPAQRSRMVHEVLLRTKHNPNTDHFGEF